MAKIELGEVTIPGWLPGMADVLIDQAEEFLGEANGLDRKQWVLQTLKAAARAHDVKNLPDWIENPAEDAIISLMVESIFSLKFRTRTPEERAVRKAERRAKRAKKKDRRAARRRAKEES